MTLQQIYDREYGKYQYYKGRYEKEKTLPLNVLRVKYLNSCKVIIEIADNLKIGLRKDDLNV